METTPNTGRRNFLKQTGAGVLAIAAAGSILGPLTAAAETKTKSTAIALTEADFRNGVMPRSAFQGRQPACGKQGHAKECCGICRLRVGGSHRGH